MTFTELKAKPGQYIWNENQIQFVGRINKDGTEDKRFSRGGVCSMLNNIIKETGYVPTNPQVFATQIAEHKSNNYLVKGYGVIVKCYDLSAEMWVAKAAEHLGVEGDGIADILKHVSKSKASEHKAKIETLALIFGKELKSSKLADYAGVTEFEKRLKQERKHRSIEARKAEEEEENAMIFQKVSDVIANLINQSSFDELYEAMGLCENYNQRWFVASKLMMIDHSKLYENNGSKPKLYKYYDNAIFRVSGLYGTRILSEFICLAIFDNCTRGQQIQLAKFAARHYWNSTDKLITSINIS